MRDAPPVNIEARSQVRVVGHGGIRALVGEREHKRQRGVVEREGGRTGDGAGHVGDAIVHHLVDDIRGLCVGGRLRSLTLTIISVQA